VSRLKALPGDNQDTSTYATLLNYVLLLGPEETAFIAGVNHSVESVNNNYYNSLAIDNASNASGVASASQTNPTATGFDSGFLTGSAQQVLTALGITIPPEDTELTGNISQLADPAKFEAESATNEMHKWVAPDGP